MLNPFIIKIYSNYYLQIKLLSLLYDCKLQRNSDSQQLRFLHIDAERHMDEKGENLLKCMSCTTNAQTKPSDCTPKAFFYSSSDYLPLWQEP